MGSVTCIMMDVVTEKSGHTIVPNAVSVCITPCAPSPVPIPYPVVGNVAEGITDPPMRTKINGAIFATTGSVLKTCHGNEPGTLKEVVSLNTAGPVFPILGAPVVLSELGMIAITGSMCISNKAPTPGAGGSASDAAGAGAAGGGTGASGSGDGDTEDPEGPSGDGGDGGDGTSEGATADERPNRYCPPEGHRAPPDREAALDRVDLRNHQAAIDANANPWGRTAANHAMFGQPGGSTASRPQAFWSGSGRAAATRDGYGVQENRGGARALEARGKGGMLPEWGDDSRAGSGSGVTNEALWKTISRRSAENASGSVDAFVVGTAREDNVFESAELPTLLHNPNLNEIRFRDPNRGPPAPVASTWSRQPDGCWEGAPAPAGTGPGPYNSNPGFTLTSDGFSRQPR